MRTPDHSGRARHRAVIGGTVAAVTAVVVGGAALQLSGSDRTPGTGPGGDPGAEPQILGVATLAIDVGPVDDPAAVEGCLSPSFAPDADSVEVLYGVKQRTADDPVPVLVLRNAAGELRLCDVTGGDGVSQVPVPTPTPDEPAVFLSNGNAAWNCSGRRVLGYTSTTWLAVTPEVDQLQQRFVVDGEPGPWFSTRASGGYIHLQTWLGKQPRTADIAVEQQLLDTAGDVVEQSALPEGEQELTPCRSGDVAIG